MGVCVGETLMPIVIFSFNMSDFGESRAPRVSFHFSIKRFVKRVIINMDEKIKIQVCSRILSIRGKERFKKRVSSTKCAEKIVPLMIN